jgi:hypothetical protein
MDGTLLLQPTSQAFASPHYDAEPATSTAPAALPLSAQPGDVREMKGAAEAELAFIRAFYASRLVRECMDARKGKPGMPGGLRSTQAATTLGAVIRRWFIGRQTVRKAAQKTEQLPHPLTDQAIAQNSALVGTAAMLDLARTQSDLVWVADSSHAGYVELTMAVVANKWCAPKPPLSAMVGEPTWSVRPILTCGVSDCTHRGRPVGDRPQVSNRKYFIDKRVRDACERWVDGYEQRQMGEPAVKEEEPAVKEEEQQQQQQQHQQQQLPMHSDANWWPDDGESSDSHSSVEGGEDAWAPADSYSQLDRPEMLLWQTSNSSTDVPAAGLDDNWMQWLPPPAEAMYSALDASVEAVAKRPRSPERAVPLKHIRTEDLDSKSQLSGTGASVARTAMQLGLSFIAVSAVAYVAVTHTIHTPGGRPADGWNCDHADDGNIIMFAGSEEICAADRSAMFPCAFECPAGSIGVGRSCRCDGCYRDGHCMQWVMNGHSPNQYNKSVAGCPEPTVVNATVGTTVEWPEWWQTPDKVPGIPNQGGAIWHDNENDRLLVTLFPAGSKCPDEKCARLVATGARASCNDALGACPVNGQSVAGVWSWDLSADEHGGTGSWWTRITNASSSAKGASPTPRNNALSFPGASSFFIFGGRYWNAYAAYEDRCTSDLWVLTDPGGGAEVEWTELSAGMDIEKHLPWVAGKQPQWPAGNSGRTAWSTPCEDVETSGCAHRLWMFGGQADYELGPVNALWAYEYTRAEELGTWTLVTGSTYDVVAFTLTEKLQPGNSKHDLYDNLQAVDPCLSTWPVESQRVKVTSQNGTEHWEWRVQWVEQEDSRCPAARYAAASWSAVDLQSGSGSSGSSGGAYVFGGLTSWQDSLQTDFSGWRNQSLIGIPKSATARVRALQDLWHFNGDVQKPVWTQIHRSQIRSETAWPPAATGHGWSSAGQLWLWVSWVGPQRVCDHSNCTNDPSAYRYVNTGAANELWVFSPQTELWERVTQSGVDVGDRALSVGTGAEHSAPGSVQLSRGGSGSDTQEFGAWPGARQGALMDGGYLFSGLGNRECVTADGAHQAPGDAFTRPLSGLWQWAPK